VEINDSYIWETAGEQEFSVGDGRRRSSHGSDEAADEASDHGHRRAHAIRNDTTAKVPRKRSEIRV
jgi:hypothetical protein